MRLNLGCGDYVLDEYENLDRSRGNECSALPYPDCSIDEVRASHLLEHFAHAQVPGIIREWVRVLKPHGKLRLSVPDFEKIARYYLAGKQMPVESFLMGGQTDDDDYHKAIFDSESLTELMRAAGLIGIAPWKSEDKDCSSYPISLNLEGYKRPTKYPRVSAVMSTPRLGFMDNFFCAFEALAPLKIGLRKQTGAFWGQCLTRAMEIAIEDSDPEYMLTIDYDTVFTRHDVESMLSAAMRHPEADAIAPMQASRSKATPLFTVRKDEKRNEAELPLEFFTPELARVSTAHFGLTLIKVSALLSTPRPWFIGTPDSDEKWGDGRIDDDIHFWRQWERAGHSLFVANRVPVGHGEFMIRWPGRDLQAIYQHPHEFWDTGRPDDSWR